MGQVAVLSQPAGGGTSAGSNGCTLRGALHRGKHFLQHANRWGVRHTQYTPTKQHQSPRVGAGITCGERAAAQERCWMEGGGWCKHVKSNDLKE